MATRRDTRSYSSGTTTNFEKVGPDGPPVVSASAWPSANTAMLPRGSSTVAALPPGPPLGHREPVLSDAESGQTLGDFTEQAAAGAARRHLSVKETAARANPGLGGDMERFIFGV